MEMAAALLFCALLCLLTKLAFPMCVLTDYTLYVEKQECDFCVAINTTICMGFCFSRDSNMKELAGPRFLIQRGCAYQEVEYRTAALPGCPLHADPLFTYPVALSCHCSTCNTHSDECAHKTGHVGGMCSKPVRPLFPYPDQSYYSQYD
ncbi:thyrotropin subunit beta-like [Denticeps clupeoides]|nr:thyrotropin subunit beta-like [Denticeps clupeoides]XP_028854947.1 thyrotropin subunit beta-like [Denticeps clupeoides]